jgi:hypothetical protein
VAARTGLVWTVVALIMGLSVLLVNGGPLYYFDSAGYFVQGNGILSFGGQASALLGDGAAAGSNDGDVSISRSPIYAVLIAAVWNADMLVLANLLNLLAVFASALLLARAAGRAHGVEATWTLAAAPIAAACLGSLAFYIAYVMPDTFIGIAILLVAGLSAYSKSMRGWEILLAVAILAFAVVVHRSHLLIAGLIIPFAVAGAVITVRKRGWIAGALMLVAVAIGVAEIKAYSFAAKTVAGKEATLSPFLTARVIEDGPGLTYLMENCPDPENASCPLAEALTISDDPFRLTAAHIAFNETRELGSFRLMSLEDQRQVANDQYNFFLQVFLFDPVGVTSAVIRNTLRQTGLVSIKMTVPDPGLMTMVRNDTGLEGLEPGRLAQDRSWIPVAENLHLVLYGLSLLAMGYAFVSPPAANREMRVFIALVLIGILINAFVCGAVSQPAERYGARVAWLLPFVAMLTLSLAVLRRNASAGYTSGTKYAEPAK